MNRREVDTHRLSKQTSAGPRVSLVNVKDRLIERVEHRRLDMTVDVSGIKYALKICFFDIETPIDGVTETKHDRSAILNIDYSGPSPDTDATRDAIKLFVVRHLKLAQAIKVYEPVHKEAYEIEKDQECPSPKGRRKIFSASSKLK